MTDGRESFETFCPPYESLRRAEQLLVAAIEGDWLSIVVVVEQVPNKARLQYRQYGVTSDVVVASTPQLDAALYAVASGIGFTLPGWRLCIGLQRHGKWGTSASVDLAGARYNGGFTDALRFSSTGARARARRRVGAGRVSRDAALEIVQGAGSEITLPQEALRCVAAAVRSRLPGYVSSGVGILELAPRGEPVEPRPHEREFLLRLRARPLREIDAALRIEFARTCMGGNPFVRCLGEDAPSGEWDSLAVACRSGASREAADLICSTLLSRGDFSDVYFLLLRGDDGQLLWRATLDGEEAMRFQHATEHSRFTEWKHAGSAASAGGSDSAAQAGVPAPRGRRPTRSRKREYVPGPVPPPQPGEVRTRIAGWTKRRRTREEIRAAVPAHPEEECSLDLVEHGKLVRLELRAPAGEAPVAVYLNRRVLRAAIRAHWNQSHCAVRGPGGLAPCFVELRKVGVSGASGGRLRIVLSASDPDRRIDAIFDRDEVLRPLGSGR